MYYNHFDSAGFADAVLKKRGDLERIQSNRKHLRAASMSFKSVLTPRINDGSTLDCTKSGVDDHTENTSAKD